MASPSRVPREAYAASPGAGRDEKPPTSLGSRLSPTGQEITLWTYEQLEQVPKQNLQTRALDLKSILKKVDWVPEDFRESLRARGEPATTILWILQGQALLLAGMGYSYTSESFGFPSSAAADEEAGPRQVFTGNLPSIKMTKETVLKKTDNYAGSPTMHEVPNSPQE